MERGIFLQALANYVIESLQKSFISRDEDGGWPYYLLEDDKDDEDESDDEDGDSSEDEDRDSNFSDE